LRLILMCLFFTIVRIGLSPGWGHHHIGFGAETGRPVATRDPAFPQVPLLRIACLSYCTMIVEGCLYGYNMIFGDVMSDCTLMSKDVEDRS
jgi:hypothetical protein